ncbi:MAG: thioesterase family protein [Chloroflexi bacterium]|nr:thioesterase family protein [Chloroflexota bacterium]
MGTVAVGQTGTAEVTVEGRFLTSFWERSDVEVLATPSLVHLLERAAAELVDPQLADGYTTVGLSVSVKHLAASPPGAAVTATARVTAVDGRRIVFAVEARDAREKVAEGEHERFVVNRERFVQRLRERFGAPA